MITIKSAAQVEKMRKSGEITKGALDLIEKSIKPGISTKVLDKIAYDYIISKGGKPNFLNYNGFPGTICTSVNDEVVHGIPSKRTILKEGDIVSVDMGTILDGWHSDAARTFPVGRISAGAQKLKHRRVGGVDAALLIHAVHTETVQLPFGIEEAKTVAIVYNRWGL